MHLLLTDRLSCPRCGPEFGLILLANRLENRRVTQGLFGCPNCRDQLPVVDGFGDLRPPPRGDVPEGWAGGPDPRPGDAEEARRLLALVGVTQGPGTLLLVGEPARHARAFADALEGVHVLACDAALRAWADVEGVSRMVTGPRIPLFSRSIRGVAVDGRLGVELLREAARVSAPKARLVVVQSDEEEASAVLREAGLEVLAAEGGTVVAARG